MRTLVLIPTRRDSVGLPGKHHLFLGHIPEIDWTLNSCKELHLSYKDEMEFALTTNDDRLLNHTEIAYPFVHLIRRKDEMCLSGSDPVEYIFHALKHFGDPFDNIMILQPTSPLRRTFDVSLAYDKFKSRSKKENLLISVCPISEHPSEYITEIKKLILKPPKKNGRQNFQPDIFFINGAIYIMDTKWFMKKKCFFDGKNSMLHVMERKYSVDINYQEDLDYANFLVEKGHVKC